MIKSILPKKVKKRIKFFVNQDNYIKSLKLGYTKSISEIYETAGIKFNFSRNYVKELASFIKSEINNL